MNNNKKQSQEKGSGLDYNPSRHMSWKNHRRHMGVKLIRFS
ncbi:hypothetical protein [Eudoraea chungangensis]|nr:hypothetical protein [Eudoraea chungangensis]